METLFHLTRKLLESYPEGLLPRTVWVTAKTKPKPRIWGKVFIWEVISGGQLVGKCNREGGKANEVYIKKWLSLFATRV